MNCCHYEDGKPLHPRCHHLRRFHHYNLGKDANGIPIRGEPFFCCATNPELGVELNYVGDENSVENFFLPRKERPNTINLCVFSSDLCKQNNWNSVKM